MDNELVKSLRLFADSSLIEAQAGSGVHRLLAEAADALESTSTALREALELLREWLAAADDSTLPHDNNDVRAMMRYGKAVDAVRAFIEKHG